MPPSPRRGASSAQPADPAAGAAASDRLWHGSIAGCGSSVLSVDSRLLWEPEEWEAPPPAPHEDGVPPPPAAVLTYREVVPPKDGWGGRCWDVRTRDTGALLGKVGWYGPLGGYGFMPRQEVRIVLDAGALADLLLFCARVTEEEQQP